MLERVFNLKERGSNISTELLAGFVTFMTMAYIIFVNSSLLSKGGVPFEGAVMATVLSAAISCIVMGLFANLPFALAAGMGYNVFFAFTVCGTMQIPWQTALGCVFWDGIIFVIIALSPWRERKPIYRAFHNLLWIWLYWVEMFNNFCLWEGSFLPTPFLYVPRVVSG